MFRSLLVTLCGPTPSHSVHSGYLLLCGSGLNAALTLVTISWQVSNRFLAVATVRSRIKSALNMLSSGRERMAFSVLCTLSSLLGGFYSFPVHFSFTRFRFLLSLIRCRCQFTQCLWSSLLSCSVLWSQPPWETVKILVLKLLLKMVLLCVSGAASCWPVLGQSTAACVTNVSRASIIIVSSINKR